MLQLGTSRFDRLTPLAVEWFRKPGWVHLGDAEQPGDVLERTRAALRDYGLVNTLRIVGTVLARKLTARAPHPQAASAPAEVIPFHYEKGDRLPYDDGQFGYIFSEHFFEHLFLDEAIALLTECFRVLRPGGVIRICVPDADLRRDYPPEKAGFPYRRMPFTHPEKHKTRWSIYSLGEALRLCGFRPLPLRYYDRHGAFHDAPPDSLRDRYPPNLTDAEFVLSLAYVQRASSLIVDGIKA
jgi:SAM-dependent methyltransferase